MVEIQSVKDIQQLLLDGFKDWEKFGNVDVVENGDYVLFNYNAIAQFEGRWTPFERLSRGLILNRKTGEVVALPFEKFFNWGESGRYTEAPIRDVLEKADGSLGILYRDPNGHYKVATRGSFTSDQALWATEFLHRKYNLRDLPVELTLLFEIIYPDNRIVVDYGDREDLVLIGVRNRFTGEDFYFSQVKEVAEQFGFSTPKVYSFSDINDILREADHLDHNQEGWVVRFADSQRFKIKGAEYLRIHRLLSGLSDRRFAEMWYTGELHEKVLEALPQGMREKYISMKDALEEEIFTKCENLLAKYASVPVKEDKKSFVLWVKENYPEDATALIALHAGKNIFQYLMVQLFDVQVRHLRPGPHIEERLALKV